MLYMPIVPFSLSALLDLVSIIMITCGRRMYGRKNLVTGAEQENNWFHINNPLNLVCLPKINHAL